MHIDFIKLFKQEINKFHEFNQVINKLLNKLEQTYYQLLMIMFIVLELNIEAERFQSIWLARNIYVL